MKASYFAAALLMVASFSAHDAFALKIDTTTGTNSDGSAKFDDPDDKIPFPHLSDDGQPSTNLQGQAQGNANLYLNPAPSQFAPDAQPRTLPPTRRQ